MAIPLIVERQGDLLIVCHYDFLDELTKAERALVGDIVEVTTGAVPAACDGGWQLTFELPQDRRDQFDIDPDGYSPLSSIAALTLIPQTEPISHIALWRDGFWRWHTKTEIRFLCKPPPYAEHCVDFIRSKADGRADVPQSQNC